MKASFLLLFIALSIHAHGQWNKIDSIQFDQKITCLCGSFQDQIYVGLSNGQVSTIGSDFNLNTSFSFPNVSTVSALNCTNPLKVFVFYRDNQSYLFLERFQSQPRIYDLKTPNGSRTDFVTLSLDQSLWMVSIPDLTLIKSSDFGVVPLYQLAALFEEKETIKALTTVKNQIIIVTNKFFHFFNIAGQHIEKLPVPDLSNPIVWKGTIQGVKDGDLVIVSIESRDIKWMTLPEDVKINSAFLKDQGNLITVSSNQMHRYFMR